MGQSGVKYNMNSREQFLSNSCVQEKRKNTDEVKVYQAKHKVTYENPAARIKKVEIGERELGKAEKVIMIVGATGSGKSTLINGIFNYILGVEWGDDFRLKLIQEQAGNQAKSQTTGITAYTIHNQPWFRIPYTLTIIDTPGFGDTAGIRRDQEITEQVKTCFSTMGPHGVDSLDAVGFVVQCSQQRLTPSQRYIFDSILSLFGQDIGDNIIMLLTFADGRRPQALAGIKEAEIPFKKFFKFNNSALYVSNKEGEPGDDQNFDEMFWKMGEKGFDTLLDEITKVEQKSLVLTKEVLEERSRLEITVQGLQNDVRTGLAKLEELRDEYNAIDRHQSDIEKNKDFTYPVREEIKIPKPTKQGQYTTNCIVCNITCHPVCIYNDDNDKAKCWAIGSKEDKQKCRICSQKCHWSLHKNQPFVYVTETQIKTKTSEELKKKYEVAGQKKLKAEELVMRLQEEFDDVEIRVLKMIDLARISIVRLNEIALRTSRISTIDYIDILITGEKTQNEPGYLERIKELENIKRRAEQIEKISQNPSVYDPFEEIKKQYADERKERYQKRLQQNK